MQWDYPSLLPLCIPHATPKSALEKQMGGGHGEWSGHKWEVISLIVLFNQIPPLNVLLCRGASSLGLLSRHNSNTAYNIVVGKQEVVNCGLCVLLDFSKSKAGQPLIETRSKTRLLLALIKQGYSYVHST